MLVAGCWLLVLLVACAGTAELLLLPVVLALALVLLVAGAGAAHVTINLM